jgi:LmbE family N-acetylglucosaminyl deacetylase
VSIDASSDDGARLAQQRAAFGGRSVLAVFAHPDDESLACGGTLARLAELGTEVVLMCASHGERGSPAGPARDASLGRTRTGEARAAAAALGLRRVIVLDHPDGDLRWADVTTLCADIALAVRRYRPAAVITFGSDGLYWHLDHVGVHERTTTAVRSLGGNAPRLYYATMARGAIRSIRDAAIAGGWTPPQSGFWSLAPDAFGIGVPPSDIVVDVEPWTPRKLAAIRCHRTQMGADPFSYVPEREARAALAVEYFHSPPGQPGGEKLLEAIGRYAPARGANDHARRHA